MREQRTIVDGMEFGKIFQFQHIFGAIGSSLQPSRLLIGLCMVLMLLAAGKIWDSISGVDASNLDGQTTTEAINQARALAIAQSATALGLSAPEGSEHWTVRQAQANLLIAWQDYLFEGSVTGDERAEFEKRYLALENVRPKGPFEASALYVTKYWNSIVDGALDFHPVQMWQGVVAIVWELPQLLWKGGFHWFISLFGFFLVYVLCIGGGAIARMQATQHSRSLRLSVSESINYSHGRWRASISAVIGPAMFVAAITVLLMVMGLILLNVPWLNLIGGVLYGLALLLGLIVALVAVGYAVSFPLLIPAVVVENCGGGEAVQRSFSYLLSKTLLFVGYIGMLIIAMVFGYLVVRLITNLTLDLTANIVGSWTFNLSLHGAGSLQEAIVPAVHITWYESMAGFLIGLWETIVHDIMIGWIFSGFFSASSMVYLLLRYACDGQDTRDIWWKGISRGTAIPSEHDDVQSD
ncbi:MAG: hypothetical protein QF718_00010 [Phycisphaerales bacterium]|jgi:hypothetical protein|nr:hypothetical protein [Phycisphaerales bacterium]